MLNLAAQYFWLFRPHSVMMLELMGWNFNFGFVNYGEYVFYFYSTHFASVKCFSIFVYAYAHLVYIQLSIQIIYVWTFALKFEVWGTTTNTVARFVARFQNIDFYWAQTLTRNLAIQYFFLQNLKIWMIDLAYKNTLTFVDQFWRPTSHVMRIATWKW